MGIIDQVCRPGRVIGRGDDCIEVKLADGCVDSVYPSVLIAVEGLVVGDAEDWIDYVWIQHDRLRELEDVLVDELRVIRGNLRGTCAKTSPTEWNVASSGIASIESAALNHAEGRGAIGHGAPVRTDSILSI